MAGTLTRILVVDDYNPWRRFVCSALQKRREFQVLDEISDGLVAVQKAQELQPELILLDIGLPTLNGIQAARRIRECAPKSRIIFVSENRAADIAAEALATGASGFVVKSDAARELLPAVDAVLQGKQFVSASLATGIRAQPASEKVPEHLQQCGRRNQPASLVIPITFMCDRR